ncbi:MAG: ISLre2 family transposase [Lachnospiraceae bacterium]|nr:ISLre2 family transposase [Lachnospiraceae bacterium]
MTIITLIKELVEEVLDAEDKFFDDIRNFPEYEEAVNQASQKFASRFLGSSLTAADEMIRQSGIRKKDYNIQRRDDRSLISTVGDISFTHTLFRNKQTGEYKYLLDELLKLPEHERLTTMAEAKILNEAEVYSYQHAAESLSTKDETITKTTVMNKVHAIEEVIPQDEPLPEEEKKQVEFLHIEADEDHIHRQKDGKENGCMIGKLIYLFEGKEDVCTGRRRLIETHYFSGLYPGSEMNGQLWDEVEEYIKNHYDQEYLKKVYISGDGGGWIKSGVDHIYKGVFVADRFHLMKYINRVSNLEINKKKTEKTKGRFYKYIYKNQLTAAKKFLTRIGNRTGRSDITEDVAVYFENNWDALQKAFHDKNVYGCSAEGHVSNVLSDRMSSRPMGWSEIGCDRMCKLRCFVRNNGREKVVDLVKYRREKELEQSLPATGTDGMVDSMQRKEYTKAQREAYTYIERLQATLGYTSTVRKTLSIREQIGNL